MKDDGSDCLDGFVAVCRVGDIADPGKRVVEVGDNIIALFHVGGQFFAIDDICTHDGGPLADGQLVGFQIICPRHGARFDIRDGRALTMPATRGVRSYEVKVVKGQVWIRVPE